MKIDPAIASYLENYFDKIFLISIKRATDRHVEVKKNLEGLKYDFFWGTDKKALDWEKIKKEKIIYDEEKAKEINRHDKGMTLGHVACSLSHRSLYEHIIEKGYERVLIFEDDVLPLSENLSQLPTALEELPPDWDLVYLGYLKNETVSAKRRTKQAFYKIIARLGLIKWNATMIDNLLPTAFSTHLKKAGYHDCTHAYAITRKTAVHLLAKQQPIVFNADNLLSNVILNGEIKAFVTEPMFFIQEIHLDPKHPSIIQHH